LSNMIKKLLLFIFLCGTAGAANLTVWIGDSLIVGYGGTVSPPTAYGTLTGYDVSNKGTSGNQILHVVNRFQADVVAQNPYACVIGIGVNDINTPPVSQAEYISTYTVILQWVQDSTIERIYVMPIAPYTGADNAKSQIIDSWNAALESLVAGFSKARFVDTRPYLGQFRVGGDAGNLWDIKTAYNTDGIHLNDAGYYQMGLAVYEYVWTATSTPHIGTWESNMRFSGRIQFANARINSYCTAPLISLTDWEIISNYAAIKTSIGELGLWELYGDYLTASATATEDDIWELSGGYLRLKN
jgi:lysophospholipase L1-like esterase